MHMTKLNLFLLCMFYAQIYFSQSIQSTTIIASKDALIDNQSPTTNYGGIGSIEAGVKISGGATTVRRSYLDFDLSGIPSNAIITSATLSLRVISEGSDVTNSSFVLERANASWVETGTGSITWSNKPAVTTSDAISTSSVSSGWRNITVTSHVQKMVNSTFSKFGWSLRRNNEGTATLGSTYRSNNYTTQTDRPKLVVNYYVPFSVSAATINHESSLGAGNGSITITVANGPSAPSYEWYQSNGSQISGATSSTISGLSYGWYGVKISGTVGDPEYFSFLVGVTCDEVTINYSPDANYVDDSPVYSSATTGNYGSSLDLLNGKLYALSRWITIKSFLKFKLWVDPNITFSQAGLNLYGNSHDISNSNASYLKKVTSQWSENTITWNNMPSSTSTNQLSLAASTTTNQNYLLIDVSNFWNDWKLNNPQNNGMLLELQTTTDSQRSMRFHSSDATSSRPSISFTFTHNPPLTGTVSAAQTNICSGSTTLLTLSGYPSGSTFQWQISIYGLAFVDIVGATNSTYTTLSSTTVDAIYRCKVSKGDCTPYTSNSVLIQNTPTPTVTVNQPDFCSGANVTITATPSVSGGTYLWSNSATTASIIVAPLTTTSYSVVYTKNGCSSSPAVSTVDVCQMHAKLERILSGNNYKSFAGKLVFYYQEEYSVGNSNLTYSIYPMNNRITPVLSGSGLSQSLEYGDNRYMLDLSSISSGTYILEVENAKKEKFYLRFTK